MIKHFKVNNKVFSISNFILIVGIISALAYATINYDTFKRDKLMLEDVHAIGMVTSKKTVAADSELMFHYSLVAYLARHYNISLDFENTEKYKYRITDKQNTSSSYKYLGNTYHLLETTSE